MGYQTGATGVKKGASEKTTSDAKIEADIDELMKDDASTKMKGDKLGGGKGSESDTPKKVEYGQHYTRKNGKKALKPDIEYETPEGYRYTTDSQGRIISAEGILQRGKAKRNDYAQQNVGKGDGRRDGTEGLGKDDGGHLIASIFKGSGNIDNLVPMDSNLNRGRWKAMEKLWADTLDANEENTVEVQIMPIYGDETQRPTEFLVLYRINEGKWVEEPYDNERSS